MNDENLKPIRSVSEAREKGRKGGKASGETRRRKANFRKTLNLLLTAEIDSPEWTPLLESLGLDSTLETALNMAMIKEGLSGNVKAYEAVARYSGQSGQTEADEEEQQSKTELNRAKKQSLTGENETDEALEKLDKILKGVYENAVKQEAE